MFSTAQTMPQAYPPSGAGIYPPNLDPSESSGADDDTTLAGLKQIVSKQQKEIESHQQQLVAKEQRLKFLKQPETIQLNEDAITAMRNKVQAQEQKLERLRELRGHVDQQRLLNVSELDSVKALFKEKERELMEAVAKVDSLTKQLDTIKKSHVVKGAGEKIGITNDELERLREELRITQEANEQKNHELAIQLDLLNQRNRQVDYLDKRIEELQVRLRKKKEAERNQVILGPTKNPNPNVATVEPSIRIEPVNTSNDDIRKVPLVPNPHDPRYQTLPNSFRYTPHYNVNTTSIYNGKEAEKASGSEKHSPRSLEYQQKMRNSPETLPNRQPEAKAEHLSAQRPMQIGPVQPKYSSMPSRTEPRDAPRPMYTSASHLPSRPQISGIIGDTNNNNRRNSADVTKKDQSDASLRPNTSLAPVNALNRPMYASRSVIADTYMKRLGPKPTPEYKATAPHSIPAFHLKNSIISDKVSSKNNTLRSLRRRHSITETDESKIEAALGPREVVPGSSSVTERPSLNESPKPKDPEPEKSPFNGSNNSSHNSSTSSDEPKVPNSGIVARQILRKDVGVKRNHDRRVTFDPLALLLDASLEGEFELVQRSATQVPDPSQPNDEGITALHNAICAGHFDIVKFLVKFGVDVNSQDIDGWTPLHCASSCNNLPMVKFLVESGACIYAQTLSDHETPAEKCEDEDDDGCSQYLYGIQEKLGVLNAGAVYALFDYQARSTDELSFRNGDKLTILRTADKDEKEWWWARLGNKEGYVPRTFLGLFPRLKM